ncbi:MAG: DUF2332 domain-containing protein [Micropepsaceae bacterium]
MQESDYWTIFADEATRIGSPLYGNLALKIREDSRLRSIAATAKLGQPHANLIFAAVHYLLLDGKAHQLSQHYPSLCPGAKPSTDAFTLFRDFCLQHEQEVISLVSVRITNTNEVARSTSLYPAFDFVARETRQDLHMVEIGPSAGFNLNWNHYAYTYVRDGKGVLHRAPADALLDLKAELRGTRTPQPSEEMPGVASKVGLELNPVNLQNPEDRLWLKALIFPELTHRIRRLEGAIRTGLAHPPNIKFGNALELLEPTVRALPAQGIPVVYHSFVTYQFSGAMREQLHNALLTLSETRPLYRVSIEWAASKHPLTVSRYDNGRCNQVVLADCNPHGAWLEWRHEAKAHAE